MSHNLSSTGNNRFYSSSMPGTSNSANTITCPSSGYVLDYCKETKIFQMQDDTATWWSCPACGGWHITLGRENSVNVRADRRSPFF
ncbi:MAG: hypothetical protein Kow0031_37940 [Anaerolineae bacterium]